MIWFLIGIFAYFIIGYLYLVDIFRKDRFSYDEIKKELGDLGDLQPVDMVILIVWPLFAIYDFVEFIKKKFKR